MRSWEGVNKSTQHSVSGGLSLTITYIKDPVLLHFLF